MKQIFQSALDRAPQERSAFVREACADDGEVRTEVESLLRAHQEAGRFAESGLGIEDLGLDLIGRDIGTYRILSQLGAGGMGEVYRARDTKLGRDVAIKILARLFTSDPGRLARFEREARVLASLNHPHIGAIYGLEDVDGVPALVLELVDGETLADRVARGPIPPNETLRIARQMADALEAAHEKGIVHRDLKPANIKITPDGVVKVLDFGLAKAASGDTATADLTQSPTLTIGGTREGIILGTAAYMSPEQTRGQSVDKRTDIWAFGCVLYEMLTGRLAFNRNTLSDTVAAIIEREPDWTVLPASTSLPLRQLLRRCLKKDPKRRLQAIGDARVQIEELISGPTEEAATQPRAQRSSRIGWIVGALSLVIAAALAVPATLYFRRVVPEPLLTRFEIPIPPTSDPASFALSADGRQLAFVATSEGTPRLWVRPLDQVTAQSLAGTEGASYPFWAPDGRAIGFFADGKLKRIDLGSGGLLEVAPATNGGGGTWNRNGVIVFAPASTDPMMRVMAAGGTPVAVTRLTSGQGSSHRWPQFLPDGRHFVFFMASGRGDLNGVYVGTLDGGEPTRVLAAETAAVYAPPGALLWVHQGVLVAQRFDPARQLVSGEPIPVAQAIGQWTLTRGAFAVSATGVLAHRAGRGERRQLTWVDRAGIVRGTVGPPDESGLGNPELAPHGRRVAVNREDNGNNDVYSIDTDHGLQTRFTFDASVEHSPVWSPDGSRVVFKSLRKGQWDLFQKEASGAGAEQPLLETGEPKSPLSWSPDGRVLLYGAYSLKTGWDIWALPLAGDRKPFPVVQTPFDEFSGQFSPNGRWLAYHSNESQEVQIYVRPFPGPGGVRQVSAMGGSQPRWRSDGKELFYVGPDARLMAVPIAFGVKSETLDAGVPVPLFRTRLASGENIGSISMSTPQYVVAPDGRFLMNLAVEEASPPPITVVLNWDAALKR